MKNFIAILVIVLLLLLPQTAYLGRYAIMAANNAVHYQGSVLKDNRIQLDIPGGSQTQARDWFPFVMLYNAHDGFTHYIGKKSRLTILYNFGAYEPGTTSSSLYSRKSAYHGAFYGAYVIQNEDGSVFGFNEKGDLLPEKIRKVAAYDYQYLVLGGLGASHRKLRFDEYTLEEKRGTFLDIPDWHIITSRIDTLSPLHEEAGYRLSYLQYGKPPAHSGESFPDNQLLGKAWVKAFEEYGFTLVFYILAPTQEVIDHTANEILEHTTLVIPAP